MSTWTSCHLATFLPIQTANNSELNRWLFVSKNAEFADQGMQGFQHLYKIAGTVPKKFEKEKKFLERVLIREDGTEKVILGKKPTAPNL